MKARVIPELLLFLALLIQFESHSFAQGTAFTYQGRLNENGSPATGMYDLEFVLYDTPGNGSAIGGSVTNAATTVSNGLFVAVLDFGPAIFDGHDRWLQISARTNGSADPFVSLTPRQHITAAPYAVFSATSGSITNGLIQNPLFIGTTGTAPLDLFAGNQRALRLEPNTNGAPNVIGGSAVNRVDAPAVGATISGGGALDYFGSSYSNRVSNDFGSIGGGVGNTVNGLGAVIAGGLLNLAEAHSAVIAGGSLNNVQLGADRSSIGGGSGNNIQTNAAYAVIAGGFYNRIEPGASGSTILGGQGNVSSSLESVIAGGNNNWIRPLADLSSIGGGIYNTIQSGADQTVIAGGNANTVEGGARESFIGGGYANRIETNSLLAFIGAGIGNVIGANSAYSTIPGGGDNAVDTNSPWATIGGGLGNIVPTNSSYATIGGGLGNYGSWASTIGGGQNNAISNSAIYSTIGGGILNVIDLIGSRAVISGGERNYIGSSAHYGSIGGGNSNSVLSNVRAATVAGGIHNASGGDYAFIGGGQDNLSRGTASIVVGGLANANRGYSSIIGGGSGNTAQANAQYATIPGGASNSVAGSYSFAAGNRAGALHNGAFVWSDSTPASFSSTAPNQFLIRASGGVGIGTNNPTTALEVVGTIKAADFQGNGSSLTGLSGANLAPASVATAALSDGAVNSAKIADGSIVAADVNATTFGTTFWKANGNAGTTPAANFLGTTDNQPLEIKVNGNRAFRLEPTANDQLHSNIINVIGGSSANVVSPNNVGATIAGGGAANYNNRSCTNSVTSDFGTVGGGCGNSAGTFSTVAGGFLNQANGDLAVVGGGQQNASSGFMSSVGGGYLNNSSGSYATVPGGAGNEASGAYSFAAGQNAHATHEGAFVWADSQAANFSSTADDQFSIRAAGGVRVVGPLGVRNTAFAGGITLYNGGLPAAFYLSDDVSERIALAYANGPGAFSGSAATGDAVLRVINGRLLLQTGSGSAAVTITANNDVGIGTTAPSSKLHVAGIVTATSFSTGSDRNIKSGFEPIDSRAILAKVAALPITRWHYTNDVATPHIGPMAQDFSAAFRVGGDDKHIATVDADGVALAAIQGLNQKLEEKDSEIRDLRARLEKLEKLLGRELHASKGK
jgi:hypothetical protein